MVAMETAKQRTESREVKYPALCKSAAAREKFKEKTLRENKEVLFTNYALHKEGRKKNNLIFFTDSIYIWKESLCKKYPYISSEGIGSGGRLKICKDKHMNKDDPLLTITYYTKGKVMVHGGEANLKSFEEVFSLIKAEVDTKRYNVPCDSEDDESPTENPTTLSISAPPTPASFTNQLKESMALLELDFAEFKELTQARLSAPLDNIVHQLQEELQQLKTDNQASTSELRGSVEALKQENSVLRAQLAKVKEDTENRERNYLCPTISALHPTNTHTASSQQPTLSIPAALHSA